MNPEELAEARIILDRAGDYSVKACFVIAKALQPVIPAGFRGKVLITVDSGRILPENVTVEIRPSQGKRM